MDDEEGEDLDDEDAEMEPTEDLHDISSVAD